MSNFIYKRLLFTDDTELPYISAIYQRPEVARYISIADNYFDYITVSKNVYFYKVYRSSKLIGTIHLEKQYKTLFMDILVFPEYQKQGIGISILADIQNDVFGLDYEIIEVAIDQTNVASIKLFEKAGFVFVSQEDELKNYVWQKEK